jgi:hypothetical protein
MHTELSIPNKDEESKTEAQVISEVLAKKTKKPMFLQNVGGDHQPYTSYMSTLFRNFTERRWGAQTCATFSTPSGMKWTS